ncbi:Defective in cullin neddylation protein [Pyrenophora teres f. teres]|uniref:Defective in cullin neddylation protein n=1 Tax=Pyrenophora teres f. teres TaxID=97479 RepID=A0A6S6VTH8_9PLEO|nr:Defective in cullin neddylation protein [Pyrenophora teres f. teres]
MFGSSQDRARQLAGRNRRERISSISSCSSSRSVSSSSRAPPLRNRQSTLDSTIPSPSAVEEHAACDESGTILGPHALEGQNQHLAEEGPPVSALQLASGQGGSQVEQHRRQAEHLSQVLYNGFALEPSVSPPQSQFSLSHQTRHSTMGSQLDTALRLRNITASDPSSHLIDPSLLKLLDSFNATTGISRLASMPDHDPTSLTTVSLRGGEGDIPLPAPYPFNNRSDYGDYVAWKRHYYRLMFRLDLDVSGAYHRTFSQQRQHFITPDFCAELQFLSQIPNSPNILVTSGYEYVAFRCTLSRRKLAHFDSLFGPPFPKTINNTNYAPLQTFFHSLDAQQKSRFHDMVYMNIRGLRYSVVTSLPQPPTSLLMLSATFSAFVQLDSPRHQLLADMLDGS